MRTPEGGWSGVVDSRPAAVKNFLAYSLARLGVDHIDIYRPSRLDPAVPIEDTVGAIAEMVKAGWVRHIGLSEVGAKTIRRAQAVHPICDLQIEYSLASRGPERDIFPAVAELGISVTAYGILSRGLLSGSAPAGASDLRSHMPRFSAANAEANRRAVAALGRLASQMGATPTQLAIAWVMARNPSLIPLVGARTRRQLDESLAAAAISLSGEELARIGDTVTPDLISGGRYQAQQMALLDSER